MTTEETQSPVEVGPASDNGQGQSQGHRRRRRRRKNKSGQAVAGAQPQQQAATPAAAPPAPAPPPVVQPPSPQQQQPRQQVRKKKKVFQKSPQPQPQPGNSTMPQGMKQRKGKPKASREFVGPMDHSYRVVNGNIADGPPSTIQMNSSSRMTHWEEPYAPVVQPRSDAPARIFCFIEDLFFLAKIQETARKLGVKVEFVKAADKEAIARVLDLPEGERPALVVFDLNNVAAKPITLIPKLKSKYKKTVSVVGFLSHLQGDLKMKATEAGCDTVMPRSAFSQSLPNLLRRYGIEEDEETYSQPM